MDGSRNEDINRKRKFITESIDAAKKQCTDQKLALEETADDAKIVVFGEYQQTEFRRLYPHLTRDSYYITRYEALLTLFPDDLTNIAFAYCIEEVFAAESSDSARATLLEKGFEYTPGKYKEYELSVHNFEINKDGRACYAISCPDGLFMHIPLTTDMQYLIPNPRLELSSYHEFDHVMRQRHEGVEYGNAITNDMVALGYHDWAGEFEDMQEEYHEIVTQCVENLTSLLSLLKYVVARYATPPVHLLLYTRLLAQSCDFVAGARLLFINVWEAISVDDVPSRSALAATKRAQADALYSRFMRCDGEELRFLPHVKSLALACIWQIDTSFCIEYSMGDTLPGDAQELRDWGCVVARHCANRKAVFAWLAMYPLVIACECIQSEFPEEVCPCN